MADLARRVAFDLLCAVRMDGAYANLTLPTLVRQRSLSTRDAALATELGYGTLRAQGSLDAIVAACSSRRLERLDGNVLDLLRLGAYQLLRTRIPPHAAVASTVDLARAVGAERAAGFVNAVLRKVTAHDWDDWVAALTESATPTAWISLATAHPAWITEAFAAALHEDPIGPETERALQADDTRPETHLVALPGLLARDGLARLAGGGPGPWSPDAVRCHGGDPGVLADVRSGRAGVQDEGSQLVARALATAAMDGPDHRWADICAGPGGKTALLAALAAPRGAHVTATELHAHRVELVRRRVAPLAAYVTVNQGDARLLDATAGEYDRVLLDAPCSGLGALRRRPEARWRRQPTDVAELVGLQGELLDAAIRITRPGGLIGYVTCSPHLAETVEVVDAARRRTPGLAVVDARAAFPGVPALGSGPTVQLWPHRHGTDAMFCALLRPGSG